MDRFDKKNIKLYLLVICVLLMIGTLMMLGLYKCPLRLLFGVPCPLCGITRALYSVLHGDVAAAFYYHPLWPAVEILLILYLLAFAGVIRPSKTVVNFVLFGFCVLLIACYIWRHVAGSAVVRIDFGSSLLYRLIHSFV